MKKLLALLLLLPFSASAQFNDHWYPLVQAGLISLEELGTQVDGGWMMCFDDFSCSAGALRQATENIGRNKLGCKVDMPGYPHTCLTVDEGLVEVHVHKYEQNWWSGGWSYRGEFHFMYRISKDFPEPPFEAWIKTGSHYHDYGHNCSAHPPVNWGGEL